MDKLDKNNKNAPPDKLPDAEEIIGSASKSKNRSRKRKRQDSGSSSDIELLPENALQVEQNLQTVALKNNLDDASMKKILKKVVTNDHVLALVKLREEEEIALGKEENVKPKLTRAKAKELMNVSPKSAPWNLQLTPIKHIPVKTRPEVEALITKELPDDEDDDEYQPTNDEVPSDDDQTMESCSDLDSQPPTPGTPLTPLQHTSSPVVTQDGPFKVPQHGISTTARRKLVIAEEEEATIALRTRSKLSLSATPIEHIESSFVPPDDVPMPIGDDLWNQFLEECLNPAETSRNEDDDDADPEYNVAADPDARDDLWNQFLEECLNPTETSRNEDDDDADPEYNVAADPDAQDDDDDNLDKSILRISKKELNDLVTELFSIMPEEAVVDPLAADPLTTPNSNVMVQIPSGEWKGKQEPISDEEKDKQSQLLQQRRDSAIRFSIGKSEPEDDELDTVNVDDDDLREEKEETNNKMKESEGANNKENRSKNTRTIRTKTTFENRGLKAINIQVEEQNVSVQPGVTEAEPPPLLKSYQEQTRETSSRELTVNIDSTVKILPEQLLILQQQLRQHVQLAASNYLQLYVNPAHWNLAPPYKQYLEQFSTMVDKNPDSVVNVCNLKPALELVTSWEESVSKDTPENKEMVEFVHNEAERGRRRYRQCSLYVGNFPEIFMKVIANSTVFQYPYLLPAMPYRADNVRKFGYKLPEDELIVLGLDQFWQYVEDNPDMYQRPRNYRAGRWGLVATCNLIVKHMFPWLTSKWLQYHVHKARRSKDNPIAKFFANRHVTKVEHKLLPYNPKLTLYEQPEYEMPKIWVRYLAKTSKRFRYYRYKRAGTGAPPQGVSVTVDVKDPIKKPLPPDFTKTIVCHRQNLKPKIPEVSQDSFDLVMVPNTPKPMLTLNPLVENCKIENTIEMKKHVPVGKVAIPDIRPNVNNIVNTASNTEGKGTLVPVTISKLIPSNNSENVTVNNTPQTQTNQGVLSTMYTVVQTSLGAYLIPLTIQNTNTVNSITAPIPSTSVVGNDLPEQSKNAEENIPESSKNISSVTKNTRKPEDINGHCQCCVLIKKICKEKQARITDFFIPKKNEEKPCDCNHRKFPKITKRLKMLVDNYKSRSWCEQRRIESMLHSSEKGKSNAEQHKSEEDNSEECGLGDIEYVTTFHMKLTRQSTLARNVYLKTRVNQILSKFDPEVDDPIQLSEDLFKAFDVDLIDLYKEFMGFLTPEQADKIDSFKDYFVHSCIGDLVKRVETEIQNKEDREAILYKLNEVFTDNVSSSCEICAAILATMTSHPKLARHVFSLFPHRVVRDRDRYLLEKSIVDISSKKPSELSDQIDNSSPFEMSELETEAAITKKRLEEAEHVDNLTIYDETLVMDCETDYSSSNEDHEEMAKPEIENKVDTEDMVIEDALDITEETIEGSIVSKTETHDTSGSAEMSPLVMSQDDPQTEVKSEAPVNLITQTAEKVVPPLWNREEDKFILELIQKFSTPESCMGRSIPENLVVNNVYQTISEKYPLRCIDDIKDRVMRILDILVVNTDRG